METAKIYFSMMKFLAFFSLPGVSYHGYFVYCFHTLPEFESMTKPQLEALLVMNYGLITYFTISAILLYKFSKRPITRDTLLTTRLLATVWVGRFILEFIYPVELPVSPIFPNSTSLVFKLFLAIISVGAISFELLSIRS